MSAYVITEFIKSVGENDKMYIIIYILVQRQCDQLNLLY